MAEPPSVRRGPAGSSVAFLGAALVAGGLALAQDASEAPVVDPVQAALDALPRLLRPSVYHGDEVEAKSGERWLGLCPRASGDELVACTIEVATVRDEIVDDEGAPPTGKEVSASCGPAPIFLVPVSVPLKPGKVQALVVPDVVPSREPLSLSLGDLTSPAAEVMLRIIPGEGGEAESCEIVLSRGPIAQTLVRYESCVSAEDREGELVIASDATPSLLWAGDLDRDGKVDLLLDTTDHYNVSAPVLFLSAPAAADELVKPVAAHFSVGC